MDLGLFIIRVMIGLLLAGHGAQKLFGWFGGYGIKGTAGWLESIGVRPGVLMAIAAASSEIIGGLLFASGLWIEIAAVLIILTMLVAIFKVTGAKGLWITANGYEYNLVLIVVALGIALIGPGNYSLEALLIK